MGKTPDPTSRRLATLTKPGRYRDGGEKGLYLQVLSPTNRSWLLRFEIDHKERWMGLGPLDLVGLADARVRARAARLLLLDGRDPIEERLAARDAQRKAESERITFRKPPSSSLSYTATLGATRSIGSNGATHFEIMLTASLATAR